MLIFRVITIILLLFMVLSTPWWVFSFFLLSSLFIFPKFYEAVLFGLFADILYGLPIDASSAWEISFIGSTLIFTVGSVLLLFIVEEVKTHVRFYH